MKLRTCKKCGWVHFKVSLNEAFESFTQFNKYYDSLSEEQKKQYYGSKRVSFDSYCSCSFCGSPWYNFRPFKNGDCPDGCTIGPIVYERNLL